jgi:PAS domain S-box-containing protein
MTTTSTDAKAVELIRFLDALDRAGQLGPRSIDQALSAPPPGLGAHEISLDKRFTRVSAGHRTLLGYNPADLVGKLVSEYVVLKETAERAMTRKLSPGAVLLPYTRTFRKADGSEISLLLIDRHLKGSDGHVTGIRTVFAETPKLA